MSRRGRCHSPTRGRLPSGVSAGQEAVWYLVYGATLWAVVAIVIRLDLGK
jgi:hypothetical protein